MFKTRPSSLLLIGAWLFVSTIAFSQQPKSNSPYSRLGLGDPVPQYLAMNAGMGGLSATYYDAYHQNVQNPASFAFLESTAFDLGIYGQFNRLEGNNEQADLWNGNLSYMALGFPLQNSINRELEKKESDFRWGSGFSLLPYTLVDYNVQTTSSIPGIDTTINTFEGTGGTYRLQLSNGVRYKNLAVGVNLGYFFGKLLNEREVVFNDLGVAYQNFFRDDISVNGFLWDFGLMYRHEFKSGSGDKRAPNGHRLIFGAYGHGRTNFSTNSGRLYRSVNFTYGDADTVVNEVDIIQGGTLPAEFTFGLAYEKEDQLRLGVEYTSSNWSAYTNEAKPEQLVDSWRGAFGVEFTPEANSYNNYFRRVRYRLGGFYQTDPRSFSTSLTQYGLTLGAGFPLVLPRQQISFINAALEVGQFGSTEDLQATYVKLLVGFTLNDNSWFFKRKFY